MLFIDIGWQIVMRQHGLARLIEEHPFGVNSCRRRPLPEQRKLFILLPKYLLLGDNCQIINIVVYGHRCLASAANHRNVYVIHCDGRRSSTSHRIMLVISLRRIPIAFLVKRHDTAIP